MLNIIGKKYLYFLISFILILPGVISLIVYGLQLSIEFTGGSRITLQFPEVVSQETVDEIRSSLQDEGIEVGTVQSSENSVIVRTGPLTQEQSQTIITTLREDVGDFQQESFETIGPTIGEETTQKALYSIAIASVLIVVYIALSFRKVPKPASSWRFGITAIATVLHDVLFLLGLFSLLGYFYNVEIDSLFITALLTVIGFSVHDTIVVFDRIRENLLKVGGLSFAEIANLSILQTLTRSLNTSFTALLVLFTLLLFGGETVRWFVVALFVGVAIGTYSSIFNAAPLIVVWQEWEEKRRKKKINSSK